VDTVSLASDSRLYPINRNLPPKSRWNRSAAQRLLKQEDIEDGEHNGQTPAQLHMTRAAYQDFGLDKFRGHIYQEVRSWTEIPYWIVKKQKKKYK
jgi:hypothetical protein